MNALIVSKFPRDFVLSKIKPKLIKLGFNIHKIETNINNLHKIGTSNIDIVFVLHEMFGHSDQESLKSGLNSSNVKVIYLSRKSSKWPEQFKWAGINLEKIKMSRPFPVQDLDGMLMKYIELKERGFKVSDMVPTLRTYWRNQSLPDAKSMSAFLSRLRKQNIDRMPQFFLDYEERGLVPEEIKSRLEKPNTNVNINKESIFEKESVVEENNDYAELLSIADDENKALKAQLEEAKQKIHKLENQSGISVSSASKTILLLKQQKEILKKGVEAQLFTPSEAFNKLCGQIDGIR